MQIETINTSLMALKAEEGKWLTNGSTYAKTVYIGKNDKATNWWDATDEEVEAYNRSLEEAAEKERIESAYNEYIASQEEGFTAPTLADLKASAIARVEAYAKGLQSFTVYGIATWLTTEERLAIGERIAVAEYNNEDNVSFVHEGHPFTFGTSDCKEGLCRVAKYAFDLESAVRAHREAIGALESEAQAYAYDETKGWPDNVTFD